VVGPTTVEVLKAAPANVFSVNPHEWFGQRVVLPQLGSFSEPHEC